MESKDYKKNILSIDSYSFKNNELINLERWDKQKDRG